MWVNRYTDVKNQAKIYFGGKTRLMWVEGDTKEKCPTCLALNGIVAFAQEWEMSGVRPQSPPNEILNCGGWNCSCTLQVTDKRRSPNALQRIMDIAISANIGEKSYNPSQPRVPAGDSEGGQWVSQGINRPIKEQVDEIYNNIRNIRSQLVSLETIVRRSEYGEIDKIYGSACEGIHQAISTGRVNGSVEYFIMNSSPKVLAKLIVDVAVNVPNPLANIAIYLNEHYNEIGRIK